jgi:chitinase
LDPFSRDSQYLIPGLQANVFGGAINTAEAVNHYHHKGGVHKSKLVIGIPLYGRSFLSTSGPGTPFQGIGQGTWEAGVYDYRALPLRGSTVHQDTHAIASWSYDPQKKEMVSFDTEEIARRKAEWIKHEGLGGGMYWELSGDKGTKREGMEGGEGKEEVPGKSLVRIVKDVFGELDRTENWLSYEGSKFDNLKNGME